MFIRIFPNSQKNSCARVSFSALLKKRLWYRCFPVNFAKFCETPLVTASVGKYKMPSKEILRIKNCIHITAILYFHLDLMSKCVSLNILELKLDCYLALIQLKRLKMSWMEPVACLLFLRLYQSVVIFSKRRHNKNEYCWQIVIYRCIFMIIIYLIIYVKFISDFF